MRGLDLSVTPETVQLRIEQVLERILAKAPPGVKAHAIALAPFWARSILAAVSESYNSAGTNKPSKAFTFDEFVAAGRAVNYLESLGGTDATVDEE